MNVSNAHQAVATQSSVTLSSQAMSEQKPSTETKGNTDSVSISNSAHEALMKEKGLTLPSWLSDTIPPSMDLSSSMSAVSEARGLTKIHDRSYADGIVTPSEQKVIDKYRDTMYATKTSHANSEFRSTHHSELNEYGALRSEALVAAKTSLGIEDNSPSLSGVNDENSQAVGNKFQEILFSNPKAMALMDTLGVKI